MCKTLYYNFQKMLFTLFELKLLSSPWRLTSQFFLGVNSSLTLVFFDSVNLQGTSNWTLCQTEIVETFYFIAKFIREYNKKTIWKSFNFPPVAGKDLETICQIYQWLKTNSYQKHSKWIVLGFLFDQRSRRSQSKQYTWRRTYSNVL